MSFLRSVVLDARPRKAAPVFSGDPSAATGRTIRGSPENTSRVEQKPLRAAHQTTHFDKSFTTRQKVGEVNIGDVSAFPVADSPTQGVPDGGRHAKLQVPVSVPIDKIEPILTDENSIRSEPVDRPDQHKDVEVNRALNPEQRIALKAEAIVIPNSGINASMGAGRGTSIESPTTPGAQAQMSGHEETKLLSSPQSFDASSSREMASVVVADDRSDFIDSIKRAETLTTQADETEITDVTRAAASDMSEENRHVEARVLKAASVPVAYSSDSLAVATSDDGGPRNGFENAVDGGIKGRQASQNVDKQMDMKSISIKEEPPQLQPINTSSNKKEIPEYQEPREPKGVHRDAEHVPRQVLDGAFEGIADKAQALVSQLAARARPAVAESPEPAPLKSAESVQQIARPVTVSASPKAVPSVAAVPLTAHSMPRVGDAYYSRPSIRPSQKERETPKVQIGQIDVVIEAGAKPVSHRPVESSLGDLASRYYLRKL